MTVWNHFSNFSIKYWTKVTFSRLLTCIFRYNKTMNELHRRQYQAQPRFQPQPHSGSKWLKPAKKRSSKWPKPAKIKFTWCDFTFFLVNLHNFRIRWFRYNKTIHGNIKRSVGFSLSHTLHIGFKYLKLAKNKFTYCCEFKKI